MIWMAKKIAVGHQLYLYQLISKSFGVGKQTFLPKVESLLEEQHLAPEDLGCESWHEVMESCSDFVTLTDFKGSRSYVTIVRNEQWDQALAKPATKDASGKGAKPWKKRKGSSLKPVKPRHIEKKKPAPEPAAPVSEAEAAPVAAEPSPEPEKAEPKATAKAEEPQAEAPEAATADAAETEAVPAPEAAAAGKASAEAAREEAPEGPHVYTLQEILAMPKEEPEPEDLIDFSPASEPGADSARNTSEPAPAASAASADGPAPSPNEAAQEAPAPAVPATPAPEPAPLQPSSTLPSSLPSRFSTEVHCKDELLSMLTRMLPFDIDLWTMLDEDWQHACATGAAEGSRSRVSFPIRFLNEDGSAPIRLPIRRSARPIAGKQWSLVLVDGDDGSSHTHEGIGIEGLPHVDEGAWSDLLPVSSTEPQFSCERAFTQFASVGSWESALGTLARMAEPERWSEGSTRTDRYPMLRECLTCTFVRLQQEGGIAEVPSQGFAAFNTGLLSSFQQDIYACFTATPAGPSPYRLEGFAQAGTDELGQKLVALVNPLPEPASYLAKLEDIQPVRGRLVSIDYRNILTRETSRLPRAFLEEHLEGTPAEAFLKILASTDASLQEKGQAQTQLGRALAGDAITYRRLCRDLDDALELSLLHARTDYRWCAPAYVPATNTLRLLVPLSLVDDRKADCALSLELMPSGSYQAVSAITLPRARVCARVISSELPSWLAGDEA